MILSEGETLGVPDGWILGMREWAGERAALRGEFAAKCENVHH